MAKRKPFVPGSSVTRKQVRKERKAAVTLNFADQDRQLQQGYRDLDTRQNNITDWFGQYQRDLGMVQKQVGQAYAAGQQDVQNRLQQSQTQGAQAVQGLQQQGEQDAASRGATYSGQGALMAQQSDNRSAQLSKLFADLLTAQGTADQSYFIGRQGVGSAAQLTERLRTDKARDELGEVGRVLASQKGAFKTDFMKDRRNEERQAVLENQVFGLKVQDTLADNELNQQKAKQDAKDRRASRIVSRRNTRDRIQAQQLKDQQSQQRAQANAQAEAKAKRKESSQKYWDTVEDIKGRWNNYSNMVGTEEKDGEEVTRKPTPAEVTNRLLGEKFNAKDIEIARRLSRGAKLSSAQVQYLRSKGINVPKRYRPTEVYGPSPGEGYNKGEGRPD